MIDYKEIIKGKDARIRIIQAFNWVPDRLMLSVQYWLKTGRRVNWNNPQRFTEKLQIYKIQSKNNFLMAICADKGSVRDYIREKGLEDILIPLIGKGIYSTPDEIDWNALPDRFVIKDTLGGGGDSVIICKDKRQLNREEVLQKCTEWVSRRYKQAGREHVYDKNRHRIIIESFLDSSDELEGMVDYKFFCFDGKPQYVYGITNRILGNGAEIGIYDLNFNLLPYVRADERPPSHAIPKPINYDRMIEIAKILSDGFPEVRIDLYNLHGSIYFGEMTFFDGSGYMTFKPDEFDYILGKSFKMQFDRIG